jgi:hypothetical protein
MPFLRVSAYDQFQAGKRTRARSFVPIYPCKTTKHLDYTTMSTYTNLAGRTPGVDMPQDFVSTDTAALASHMSRCASARSRFFNVHAVGESLKSLFFSRMVTALLIAVVLVSATALV